MSVEENKSLGRRYFDDLWTAGDEGFIDRHVAPDYLFHDPGTPGGVRGTDGLRRYYGGYRSGFPDMRFTVEDQVAEGDKVVTRWSVDATQTGPFLGLPATGDRPASRFTSPESTSSASSMAASSRVGTTST